MLGHGMVPGHDAGDIMKNETKRIIAAQRPFVLTFHATGASYPLTSDDAQRLLDEYPAVSMTRNRVILPGHNTSRASERCTLRPATIGGGLAFSRA